MKPNEIFLNGCLEIANDLVEFDFRTQKNGQLLKKSFNKDVSFEIHFQSSHNNNLSSILIWPHFSVSSNELKKWMILQTKNTKSAGIIYSNSIGYVSPYNCLKKWNLAGETFNKNIQEIIKDIKLYIIPIMNIFQNNIKLIEYLKINGTQFNKWTEKSLMPICYLIYLNEKDVAEILLKNYIESCNWGNKIKSFYKKLETEKDIDVIPNEFIDADILKIAYKNGIKVL